MDPETLDVGAEEGVEVTEGVEAPAAAAPQEENASWELSSPQASSFEECESCSA